MKVSSCHSSQYAQLFDYNLQGTKKVYVKKSIKNSDKNLKLRKQIDDQGRSIIKTNASPRVQPGVMQGKRWEPVRYHYSGAIQDDANHANVHDSAANEGGIDSRFVKPNPIVPGHIVYNRAVAQEEKIKRIVASNKRILGEDLQAELSLYIPGNTIKPEEPALVRKYNRNEQISNGLEEKAPPQLFLNVGTQKNSEGEPDAYVVEVEEEGSHFVISDAQDEEEGSHFVINKTGTGVVFHLDDINENQPVDQKKFEDDKFDTHKKNLSQGTTITSPQGKTEHQPLSSPGSNMTEDTNIAT